MKKSFLLLIALFGAILTLSAVQLEVKRLDYSNQQELDGVCDLFNQNEKKLEDKKAPKNITRKCHCHTWICKSTETQKICGFLECYPDYRGPDIVDIIKLLVHRDYNWIQVAPAMLAHAEPFYSNQLGMKKIMIYRPTEYYNYKKLGFYDVQQKEGESLFTGTELFGHLFLCIILPIPCVFMLPYLIAKDLPTA